jgi:transaldolase
MISMKIFLDTADINEIREAASWGIIDGVTTNPTLVAKTGRKFAEVVRDITAIVDGPISLEATSDDAEGLVAEARVLSAIHKNVVVKIPITTEGLKAIKRCRAEKIKTNTTLIFSANQALLAAKAGTNYVSPFIGRLDDQGQVGMDLVRELVTVFFNYEFDCEILVASVRHPIHVLSAAILGADICTVPFDVLRKMVGHSLTDVGIARFKKDWAKVPK